MPADSAPAERSVSNGSGRPNVATTALVSKLTAVFGPSDSDAPSVVVLASSVAVCRLGAPSDGLGDGDAGACCRAPLATVTGTEAGSRFTHQGSGGFTT